MLTAGASWVFWSFYLWWLCFPRNLLFYATHWTHHTLAFLSLCFVGGFFEISWCGSFVRCRRPFFAIGGGLCLPLAVADGPLAFRTNSSLCLCFVCYRQRRRPISSLHQLRFGFVSLLAMTCLFFSLAVLCVPWCRMSWQPLVCSSYAPIV